MNISKQGFLHLFLSLFTACTLLACEGGKSNKGGCDPSIESCPPPQTKQCPTGKQRIDGVCKLLPASCSEQTTSSKECTFTCPEGQQVSKGGDTCELKCPAQQHLEDGVCIQDSISIEITHTSACSEKDTGYIQVAMQFIARDAQGYAIDPDLNAQNQPTTLSSEILIDGQPTNIESDINHSSTLLNSDLVLSLVLDNSGSMKDHVKDMEKAAIDTLTKTKAQWESTNSKFDWQILWFNDYLYKPTINEESAPWTINDVSHIPSPSATAGTELYKAVHHMAGVHQELHSQGIAAKTRDKHIMVVLSDGEDTHSHFDNSGYSELQSNAEETLYWKELGWHSVGLDASSGYKDLLATLQNAPDNLHVHVIGFGSGANKGKELEKIAAAGKGRYFDDQTTGASQSLSDLFDKVQKEFITIQTIGVRTSPENGSYNYTIHAKHKDTLAEGNSKESFTVTVGNLDECPAE